MKTIDIEFSHLCDEIDFWKERASHYEELYKEEMALNAKHVNESIESAKKGVANALMFCLSVKDSPEGDLIIKKEDRKALAENYK